MTNYAVPGSDWFRENDLPPPETNPHGTDDDVRSHLKPLKTWNWRQEGNILIAETEHGILSQTVPTDYICHGTDPNGKPILQKIKL